MLFHHAHVLNAFPSCTGLTSKTERAAVGEAAKLWSDQIMGDSAKKMVDVILGSEVHDTCGLKVKVVFQGLAFKANQTVRVCCYIKHDSPTNVKNETQHSLPIIGIQLCTRWLEDTEAKSDKALKWEGSEKIEPGETFAQKFEFLPSADDVGKRMVAYKAIVTLGTPKSLNLRLHMDLPIAVSQTSDLSTNQLPSFINISELKGSTRFTYKLLFFVKYSNIIRSSGGQ
jgi:hypothetical protein